MSHRTVALISLLLCAPALIARHKIVSEVSIEGGRWQIGSNATSTLLLTSGGTGMSGYIGHTHKLSTTTRNQAAYPTGLGTIFSALTNTASSTSPIPVGCNSASILGQSLDPAYPADSDSRSAGPLCFYNAFVPYQYYDSAGSTSDDGKESPLIFDMTGHGYRLTSARDGVRFDIRNEGTAIQIAWTAADSGNAFLALDRNGNGTIDNGTELFGSRTPTKSGTAGPTGFHALADLDTNSDYLIDRFDAAWGSLLLWTDRNHDGASTADELQPIGDSAIVAMEIDFQRIGREDRWGNDFRLMSHARFGEERRSYFDVWLVTRDRVAP